MMIKKIVISTLFLFLLHTTNAQTGAELYETGKRFLVQGDIDNAVLVLKKAVQSEPENTKYLQELAAAYFYKEDYKTAQSIIDKLVNMPDAEAYAFYLAYNINLSQQDLKAAEKNVKKGLKLHENSGLLYHALGDIYGSKGDQAAAITQWELGLKKDPGYAGNYYDASRYYYFANNLNAKIWAIYYGEVFVNMESASTRTLEIKELILNSYKMIATDESFGAKATKKNDFETLFMEQFNKTKSLVSSGVTTENLLNMRSVFIYNWFSESSSMNLSLYTRMQELLREGHFEEYNYWLFEPIQNLAAYDNWMKLNQSQFNDFMKYHQSILFKPKALDYQK